MSKPQDKFVQLAKLVITQLLQVLLALHAQPLPLHAHTVLPLVGQDMLTALLHQPGLLVQEQMPLHAHIQEQPKSSPHVLQDTS